MSSTHLSRRYYFFLEEIISQTGNNLTLSKAKAYIKTLDHESWSNVFILSDPPIFSSVIHGSPWNSCARQKKIIILPTIWHKLLKKSIMISPFRDMTYYAKFCLFYLLSMQQQTSELFSQRYSYGTSCTVQYSTVFGTVRYRTNSR